MEEVLKKISENLIKGNAPAVEELVASALKEGIAPKAIMDNALVTGMAVVGNKFKNNELFLPEVMIAARAMKAGLKILEPVLRKSNAELKGTLVLGTVRGDLHDVGKNMVSMMFRGAGFEVIDLGIDVPDEVFVEKIREHCPEVVGLSALLSTTLPAMKSTVEAINAAGLHEQTIIMVGGAPVTKEFANEIGADGWAPDAASAVEQAAALLKERTLEADR
ncbi:MAG: corrinoid protein [Deltaproteobacteria bacterium]|nr:corrinoid protein [Deltaproteobacteria bacterium]